MDYYEQGCDNNFGNACLYLGKSLIKESTLVKIKNYRIFKERVVRMQMVRVARFGRKIFVGTLGIYTRCRKKVCTCEGCKNDDNDACKLPKFNRGSRIEADSKELKSVIKSYQSDIDNLSLQLDTNLNSYLSDTFCIVQMVDCKNDLSSKSITTIIYLLRCIAYNRFEFVFKLIAKWFP